MYEAKQNKEKVSRRIDSISGGAHQRVKKTYSSKFRMIQFFGVHTLDNDRNLLYQQASARINASVGNALAARPILNALFPNDIQGDVRNNTDEHHIIPKSILSEVNLGGNVYAFNTSSMGVVLPSTIGLSALFGRIAHRGAHPNYSFWIKQQLNLKANNLRTNLSNLLWHYSANFANANDSKVIAVNHVVNNAKQNLLQNHSGIKLF